jgi:hypothetical protein
VDEHKDIADTAADEAANKELNEQIRWHQAKLRPVQEEMKQALKVRDEETRPELEEVRRKSIRSGRIQREWPPNMPRKKGEWRPN